MALSVYGCGRAEQILGKTDPGSVVLDEIAALPVCFIAWIAVAAQKLGRFPDETPRTHRDERARGVAAHRIVLAGFEALQRANRASAPAPGKG